MTQSTKQKNHVRVRLYLETYIHPLAFFKQEVLTRTEIIMIKRFIQSMFCLAILVSLTACGGGGGGGGGSSSESNTDQSTAASQDSSSHKAISQSSIDTSQLDPSINENIVIKVVADDDTPFDGAYVEWKESYSDTPQEFVDAILIDEEQSQWMIDQFPEGIITVKATKYIAWENDPSCHYFYEGTIYIDTAIDEVQEVSILVEQLPSVCE